MVCLHGFVDTWRVWELVLPALERRHDVLAVTLAGHAGGPPIAGEITDAALADAVERAMDDAGFELAHLVGSSLGGYLALQLAARGRARTVVALAPAGGCSPGGDVVGRRHAQEVGHARSLLEHVRKLAVGVHRIDAAPAVAPAYQVARFLELAHDPVRGQLRDADAVGDVAQPHLGLAGDAEESVRVVREQAERRDARTVPSLAAEA
jgi:pimeloyl-ACP methyl ester carboxylesterase